MVLLNYKYSLFPSSQTDALAVMLSCPNNWLLHGRAVGHAYMISVGVQ